MVPYRSLPKKPQTNNNAKKPKNKSQKTKHTKQTPPQMTCPNMDIHPHLLSKQYSFC